ncbi:hypothetical protein TIFTF001_018739 [Ficus carica]|uniref:Uncharacterized protein n=1 Tax=Ficus carica TaxID=3494 RepID=A0AA88ANV6_FICCA|nr:hypothetical protein TIFTF001_018739 [Ficus carica]
MAALSSDQGYSVSGGSANPSVIRPRRIREEQPDLTDAPPKGRRDDQRSREPLASLIGAELIRRKSSTQNAVVAKFDDRLISKVAESSRHSGNIRANKDMIDKLVKPLQPYGRQGDRLVAEVKRWRDAEKVAAKKAKKAEEHALKAEEVRKKAENELASARSEHFRYLREVLPTTLDQGMRDMNASFILANLSLTKEEGVQVAEVVVVIEEPETTIELRATECALEFRLVACKRAPPQSKGDTSGVSAKVTLMFKSVNGTNEQAKKFGFLGDPDGSYSEWSRRVLVLAQVASNLSVWSGGGGWRQSRNKDSSQLVQYGAAKVAWADHPEEGLVVVGEVLPEPVPWIPTVVCSGDLKES